MIRRHFLVVTQMIVATAVCSLVVRAAVAGECPFDWRSENAVTGIETVVTCLVTWDPDGAGPQQPVLVAGGRTKITEGVYTGAVAIWNGATWQTLGTGMNERVNALTVFNGTLIVGGEFTMADGNPANCIAWWNGSSWQELGGGLSATSLTPRVLALLPHDDVLIVGGAFRTAGGQNISRSIVIWNGQSWQSLNTGLNSAVQAVAVYNGEIIAGGGFGMVQGGGTILSRIARWNGATWQPLMDGINEGVDEAVYALKVFANELIVGGSFSLAGGSPAARVAAWDGSSWSELGGGVDGDMPTVHAFTIYDEQLIAGGRFSSAGGQAANNAASWNGSVWAPLGSTLNSRVEALALNDSDLYAGGFFSAGSDEFGRVAVWGPACLRGDMNCDETVNDDDVPLFVQALLDAPDLSTCDAHAANVNADVETDGSPRIDGWDIAAFVDELLGA